jgi:hypothetical protein
MYGCKDGANCNADKTYITARTDIEKTLKSLPLGYESFDPFDYWKTAPGRFSKPLLLSGYSTWVAGYLQ